MSDIADPNVSVQNAVISGAVNSSMLGILLQGGYKNHWQLEHIKLIFHLVGIYTTVYLATAYIYSKTIWAFLHYFI